MTLHAFSTTFALVCAYSLLVAAAVNFLYSHGKDN